MSLLDELKKLARPYEDEDEYYDDEEVDEEYEDDTEPEPEPESRRPAHREAAKPARVTREPVREVRTSSYRDSGTSAGRTPNKVVNIAATTQLQVVLVRPEKFENASEIADHLREKRTVVLNLESTSKEIARRLIDFLSGVAYAQEGKIKKVSAATYIITPFNVDIIGDHALIDELENSGFYF